MAVHWTVLKSLVTLREVRKGTLTSPTEAVMHRLLTPRPHGAKLKDGWLKSLNQ